MNKHVTIVTDDSFATEVLQASTPVLVDFWAEWCGPCRMVAPTVEKVAEKFADKIKVVKLNVDENSKTASEYNIRGIPTLMLFKDGEIASTKTGAVTETQLTDFINENM